MSLTEGIAARTSAARPARSLADAALESDLEIECVDSFGAALELKDAWRTLEERAASPFTYFQSFDWCTTWWRVFATGGRPAAAPELQIYTGRRDGRLVMLWPLMAVSGPFGLRLLTPIGGDLCQYGGILADPDHVSACDILAFWSRIGDRPDIDLMALECVPSSSRLAAGLAGYVNAVPCGQTSIIDISSSCAAPGSSRGGEPPLPRSLKRRMKKLAGGEALNLVSVPGGTDAYGDMARLALAWKADWLRHTGRFSKPLSQPLTAEFLASLSDGALALVLQRGDTPVALEIGFVRGRHFYSYLGAFDWSLRRFSPGRIQIERTLAWLAGQGIEYYDLLGNASSFKQEVATTTVPLESFYCPATLLGFAYAQLWMRRARPVIKRSFYGLPLHQRQRLLRLLQGAEPTRASTAQMRAHISGSQ